MKETQRIAAGSPRRSGWPFRWIPWLSAALLSLALLPVLLWRFVDPPLTGLMVKRLAQAAAGHAPWRFQHRPVGLQEISPNLVLAVLASEDQGFLDHHGFDWDAIRRAREYNRNHVHKRGASTLSQQTAKNVFLWEDRSWLRKGLEVPYTEAIEILWGKRRILEAYLNCVEFGPGIYGAQAASLHYFGIPASRLTVGQASLLAATLPAPRRNNPDRRTAFLLGRAAHVAGQIPLQDRRRILANLGF